MGSSQQFTKCMYGPEASAYGTEAVSYTSLSRVEEASIDSDNGLVIDYGLGDGLNAVKAYYGPFNAVGRVKFKVNDFDFLKHWIGHKSGSGNSGSHYILTEATTIEAASAASGKLIPFSFEKQNSDSSTLVEFATGCVGTSFTLTGEIGKPLICDANFVAQKSGYRATATGTYVPSTSSSFILLGGSYKWGATPSAVSGVRNFTISYDNGLIGEADETRTIDSRFRTIPRHGQRSYKFTLGVIMASGIASTLINDFYGDSSGGTYIPNTGATSATPTTSLEFKIELVSGGNYAYLQLDDCVIDSISQPVALGGGLQIINISGTSLKGLGNVPIEWWA